MTILGTLPARGRRAALIAAASLALSFSASYAPAGAQPYGAPPPASYAPTPQAAADARQDRIEELETQVQAATAENERLQYQLMQAEREITRLRNLVGELADTNAELQQPDPAAPPAGGAEGQSAGLNPAQQAHTGTLGTLPAREAAAAAPAAPAPEPVSSAEAFRQAQYLLLNNRMAEAEVAFGEFLRAHASAPEAPDARFWHAYTLLARNNFDAARDGFIAFMERYPNHNRYQEAQVRLGMALVGLGENRVACAAFRDLPRGAARAVRDLAAREARAANCPA